MAQFIADRRDIDFVLYEQFGVEKLSENEAFAEFNRKTMDMVVSEARNLALKEVLPTNAIGDRKGCIFNNGTVTVPEEFHKVWQLYRDGEWIAMTEKPEWGGQGMPHSLAVAATEYLNGANMAMFMYVALTHGAANLIEAFGTDKQKKLYLKNMYSGKWCGTMLLTEPNAGSDVGALETSARKNPDGTYSITGNKIFISSGENDLVENIIHPVLARIEGAPAGTRGISLFLVPKIRVNDDGSMGELNDVVCTGIEHKMGIHGNCTCSLSLGSKGGCVGTLLGEENKGMKAMFQMMNEARLYCGVQGLALASSSYMNAVNYAKERIQGPNLMAMMDKNAASVPIIQHPDVRRQLMNMKVYVEGIRSLLYYVAYTTDRVKVAASPEEKERLQNIVDMLIPVAKGYVTDKGYEVCSHGVQVFGGYGFIEEYPQAQILRDARITMLYEGTNGIQAMDLLGRKLGMKKGKAVMDLFAEIQKVTAEVRKNDALKDLGEGLEEALEKLGQAAMHMGKTAMSSDVMSAFAFAHPFLEATGDVIMAWFLLWRAQIASQKVDSAKKDRAFYIGQMKSAEFFIESILPVSLGKMNAILKTSHAAIEIPEDAFG